MAVIRRATGRLWLCFIDGELLSTFSVSAIHPLRARWWHHLFNNSLLLDLVEARLVSHQRSAIKKKNSISDHRGRFFWPWGFTKWKWRSTAEKKNPEMKKKRARRINKTRSCPALKKMRISWIIILYDEGVPVKKKVVKEISKTGTKRKLGFEKEASRTNQRSPWSSWLMKPWIDALIFGLENRLEPDWFSSSRAPIRDHLDQTPQVELLGVQEKKLVWSVHLFGWKPNGASNRFFFRTHRHHKKKLTTRPGKSAHWRGPLMEIALRKS